MHPLIAVGAFRTIQHGRRSEGPGISGSLVGAAHEKGQLLDPRKGIADVKERLQQYKYVKVGGSDQHWGTDPNDPSTALGPKGTKAPNPM